MAAAIEEGYSDTYVRNLSVSFDVNLLGKDGSAEFGRVGHQAGAYFFKRKDFTPEYQQRRHGTTATTTSTVES